MCNVRYGYFSEMFYVVFSSLNRRTQIFMNLYTYLVFSNIITFHNVVVDVDSVDYNDSENLNHLNAICVIADHVCFSI